MKDKTNYKLLVIPIFSSILLAVILTIILIKNVPIDEYFITGSGIDNTFASPYDIAAIFGMWICFLLVFAVLTIASIRLKKISISFSVLLLFLMYNAISLFIIPSKDTKLTIISIILIIYSSAMVVLEVMISKPKGKAS